MTTADQDRRAAEEIAGWAFRYSHEVSQREIADAIFAIVRKAREEEHRMVEQANRMIVIPIPKGTKTVTYAADRPSRIEVDLRKRAVLIYRHDRDEIGITPSPPESERSDKVRQEK